MARDEYVLPANDFQQLCAEPALAGGDATDAITDPDEQRALLRLLHDLGVVVAHGLDRQAPAAMREITLLDPNWLTGAIDTILNEPKLRDQGGEFAREQLTEWLDPALYPAERHEFILTMMQDPDIRLCFELPATDDHYLVPEALPPSAPYYENWPDDSLRFRINYGFLPRHLVPSLIVAAHGNLAQPPTRWRTGVILEAAQCPILVRGDLDRRRIDIAVDGPERRRRSALNIILNYLDDLHARNPEVGALSRVPLPDRPDLDVSYDHLLTLEDRHGPDHVFDPEGADRSYSVRELLDGVRREPRRYEEVEDELLVHRIGSRDNARVTVVGGGYQKGNFALGNRGRVTQVGSGTPNTTDGDTPAQLPERSGLAAMSSWRYFSIACGGFAALFVFVMMLLPSYEWRAFVGWPIAIGVGVAVLVMSRNPARFYRRLLSYVVAGGLFLAAAGFSINIFAQDEGGIGHISIDGGVGSLFFLAWAAIVIALVVADLWQSR